MVLDAMARYFKYKNINLQSLRSIYELKNYSRVAGEAIETEYHYSGYFKKQEADIKSFRSDKILKYRQSYL